jgi:arylsulfatase A-like enzyme
MKSIPLLIMFAMSVFPGRAEDRPNVVIILTDDQGAGDAGCYGAKDIETPAIDRLAKHGVRFTQFYAASAICSPSRAGLLTGRYPWLAGMPENGPAAPSEEIDNLSQSNDKGGLPSAEVTMAEMFKAAGYRTAHIGKWHLGSGPGSKPLDQGFDISFGHMNGCIDNYSHFIYWNGPNRHDLWEGNRRVRMPGQYFPDLMVKRADRFLDEAGDKPFFLYFALNLPHYPYQGEIEWLEKYKDVPFPRNLYGAALSTIDERVGQLLDSIETRGLTRRTIVIYQSDQGHSAEERAFGGGGSAGPYRGAKFSLFEGGIRMPAIVSWPGHIPENEVRAQLVHGCDWFPTVAAMCGVKLPDVKLDGKDISAVIASAAATSPHDVLQWKIGRQWAVRRGPWKLIRKVRPAGSGPALGAADKEWFLANVATDPGEKTNLHSTHPAEAALLKKLAP